MKAWKEGSEHPDKERLGVLPIQVTSPHIVTFGSAEDMLITPSEPKPEISPFINILSIKREIPEEPEPRLPGTISSTLPKPLFDIHTLRSIKGRSTFSELTSIGSSSENTIIIDEPSVSAQHAELYPNEKKWYLTDKHSIYGTYSQDIETAREGLVDIPPNEWRLIPTGRDITFAFGETRPELHRRGGIVLFYYKDLPNRIVPLPTNIPITIGRDYKLNDIVLNERETKVREKHATIVVTDAGLLIRNDQSLAKTQVISKKTQEIPPPPEITNLIYMRDHRGFETAYGQESLGGNAGYFEDAQGNQLLTGTVNFHINRKTGEIVHFSNQRLPAIQENRDIVYCSFRALYNAQRTIIETEEGIIATDEIRSLSEEARQVLRTTVNVWNTRDITNDPYPPLYS